MTHLRFFELESNAASLRQGLADEYPARGNDFRVIPGDCNATIGSALQDLSGLNWAPTFAFLDQQSTEVHWTTIEALARHKRPSKPKTEIWILCANGLLPRGLRLRSEDIDEPMAETMNRMFGTDIWVEALTANREGLLTPGQFRGELTNLLRYRLEHDLGYEATLDFQVTNTGGSEIFNMIFATDHWAGEKIMTDLYNSARERQPALRMRAQLQRRQERDEDDGQLWLLDSADLSAAILPADVGYKVRHKPQPPRTPYRLPGHSPRHAHAPGARPPLRPTARSDRSGGTAWYPEGKS